MAIMTGCEGDNFSRNMLIHIDTINVPGDENTKIDSIIKIISSFGERNNIACTTKTINSTPLSEPLVLTCKSHKNKNISEHTCYISLTNRRKQLRLSFSCPTFLSQKHYEKEFTPIYQELEQKLKSVIDHNLHIPSTSYGCGTDITADFPSLRELKENGCP